MGPKIKKVIWNVGASLKVRLTRKNSKTGHVEEYWHDVPQIFGNRQQAQDYANKKFPGVKAHVEGIRVDATPVYWEPRKRGETNDQGQS